MSIFGVFAFEISFAGDGGDEMKRRKKTRGGLFLWGGRGDGEVKVPFLGRRWCVRRYWKVLGGDFVSI